MRWRPLRNHWFLSQALKNLRTLWWAFALLALTLGIVLFYYGAIAFFNFALVLVTAVLVLATEQLAAANQSVARSAVREEIRKALEAAREFSEIKPDALRDVLHGNMIHPILDSVSRLASFGNCLHDKDTVRALQVFASEVDNAKIGNASIGDAEDKLTKLQQRIISEMVNMRRDLRDVSKDEG